MIQLPKGVDVGHVEVSMTQEKDDLDDTPHIFQCLTVRVEDAAGGPYLAISTDRWAFDIEDIDQFADLLRAIAGVFASGSEHEGGEETT